MAHQKEDKAEESAKPKSAVPSLQRIREFVTKDIWDFGLDEDPSMKSQWVAILRVLYIAWKGLGENRLFSRAAALSYSSLIALGPLVAIAVFLSGSLVRTDAEVQIKRALLFIAPSLQEMVTVEDKSGSEVEQQSSSSELDELISQIVEGAEELVGQINTAGSTTFGLLGTIIFIWIVIQLLTSVETSLNEIWGVHQGRPWSQRIVFYWTFISLGALLGLGSTALFSASNLARMTDYMPFGGDASSILLRLTPLLSFAMLVILLTLFYRFFPNTSVKFRPALLGSLITACLLILNNYLSILYVQRVLSFQSLYGSLGIIPVMMIGLYFFWLLVLLGGQLTYAAQNISFMANQTAWQNASSEGRELVTLAAFILIARRFLECQPAPTPNEISRHLKIPVNILNESLGILENLDWITRISREDGEREKEKVGFRPAKPLKSYSLSRFRTSFESVGESHFIDRLLNSDPLVGRYTKALKWHEEDSFFQTDLVELLEGSRTASS